jgi:hypothetical protein
MLESNIKCRYLRVEKDRFCQGDILKDVSITLGLNDTEAEGQEMNNFDLPYCVVMNQDCDLQWDFELRKENKDNDKFLPTILVCPAYLDERYFVGSHIESWKMRVFDGESKKKLLKNDENNRCHFLKGDSSLQVPNLIIDFKHFYTIPRDLLYSVREKVYLATVNELFRERLSQRFANYLSRFGLPELKN